MREFGFELSLCARLEAEPSVAVGSDAAVIARQLGGGVHDPGGRVLDTVVVEPGPEFDERAAIASERIPRPAIEADVGPGRARRVTQAIDARPDRARAIAERAAEVGFFELERRGGHLCARQTARYPERWFGELVGIENKPDLGSPGALETQLRTDVSLGLVDRAVLATESYVTGAHRNRIPDEVGIWRYRPESGDLEVLRESDPLPVDEPGVELLDRHPGHDEIAIAGVDGKRRARRRIAERAYGKGWRTYEPPACASIDPDGSTPEVNNGSDALPHCAWKGRLVDPASECGADCPGYDSAEAPPELDLDAERAVQTPWDPDPEGRKRRQAGLDRFE